MVSRLHHERGLYAHRHSLVETLSAARAHSARAEHDKNYCFALLHYGRRRSTFRPPTQLILMQVISLITTSQRITNLPVGFIAVSLGLNWLLMLYFGAKLGRYKIMLYPLMFVLNPFFNWLYMVYGIFTAGQRTWGGPRADAGKADEKTSPEQAIEKAAAEGDELNVIPETFRPAVEAVRHRVPYHVPLMPSGSLEGRFAPAEEVAGGWYVQTNDSGVLQRRWSPRRAEEGRPYYSRESSTDSRSSSQYSTYTPRRVESIVGLEDVEQYRSHQVQQRPAGGAHFEDPRPIYVPYAFARPTRGRRGRSPAESVRSTGSDGSISMHFDVPARGRAAMQASPEGQTMQVNTTMLSAPPAHSSNTYTAGMSPLARKSFTRLATDDAASAAGGSVLARRHSAGGEERRGRRSVSVDRHGRRRLSKVRGGRRANSQG